MKTQITAEPVADIIDVEDFGAISNWHNSEIDGKIVVRIIKRRNQHYLDIREHLTFHDSPGFYTRRGIRITIREIKQLISILPNVLSIMESLCTSQSVTDADKLPMKAPN